MNVKTSAEVGGWLTRGEWKGIFTLEKICKRITLPYVCRHRSRDMPRGRGASCGLSIHRRLWPQITEIPTGTSIINRGM